MNYPRALLAAYALVVVLALLVAGTTTSAAFGAYNPAWDGASDLRTVAEATGAEAVVVRNTSTYGEQPARASVAVVLSPDRPYDERAAADLRQFVEEGGTLVVAEDFGPHGNDLLEAVGADARLDGRPLRDERHNHRSPALPVATNVTNASRVGGAEQLTLNHGTAVRPNGTDVLVRTSGFAYLDENGNGALDDDETLDAYPVVTTESVGAGRVVTVGDPSLMINAMLEREGNRQFVAGLFAGERYVLLDYSHAERLPPLAAARLSVQRSPLLQVVTGVLAVLAVAGWARGREADAVRTRLRQRFAPSEGSGAGVEEAALVSYLESRHPDWDHERVQQVVESRLGDDRE